MEIEKIEEAYHIKMCLKEAIRKRDAFKKRYSIRYVELVFNAGWPVKDDDRHHIEQFSNEFAEEIRSAYIKEYDRIVAEEQKRLDELCKQ